MTKKEAKERWASFVIPAVFRAEMQLQKEQPQWKERLKNIPKDKALQIQQEYCLAIAEIVMRNQPDIIDD